MKTTRTATLAAIAAAIMASIPLPLHAAHHAEKPGMKTPMSDPASMTEGEIRKVDKAAGKITIKHGPIANLDMPAMTMVFRVTDAAMLDRVKAGDKVSFAVEKLNGALTVTRIEVVQ